MLIAIPPIRNPVKSLIGCGRVRIRMTIGEERGVDGGGQGEEEDLAHRSGVSPECRVGQQERSGSGRYAALFTARFTSPSHFSLS